MDFSKYVEIMALLTMLKSITENVEHRPTHDEDNVSKPIQLLLLLDVYRTQNNRRTFQDQAQIT